MTLPWQSILFLLFVQASSLQLVLDEGKKAEYAETHPRTPENASAPSKYLLKAEPIAWTHIPKCGSSLENSLVRLPGVCPDFTIGDTVFGKPDKGFQAFHNTFPNWQKSCVGLQSVGREITGNCLRCAHAMVGSSYANVYHHHGVIFLRQPEQRVISMYENAVRDNMKFIKGVNQKDFAIATKGCAVRTLTKEYKYPAGVKNANWLGCMGFNETYQVEPSLTVTSNDVVEAKRRLRGYAFVGISEEWSMSICLLHAMFGGECHPAEFADANPGSSSSPAYSTSSLQGVVDHYDGELYKEARLIFESNRHHYGVTPHSCQACFRAAGLGP